MVTDRPWPMSRSVTARAAAALSPATNLRTTFLVRGAVLISWRTCWLAEAASRTRRSTAVHLHEARAEEPVPAGTGYSCATSLLAGSLVGLAAIADSGRRCVPLLLLISVFAQGPSLARVKPPVARLLAAGPPAEGDLDVSPRIRRHDDLLSRADPSNLQRFGDRDGALDQRQRDRPELVVPGGGSGAANCRRTSVHRIAGLRQPVRAPVQVQHDEPARRMAEVMYPGNGLLAAVAALVQLHGGLDPAHLVRDRPVIGVDPEPRPVRGDPQRLVRSGPGQPEAATTQAGCDLLDLAALDDQVRTEAEVHDGGRVVGCVGVNIRPHDREHDVAARDVFCLDAHHEPHRLEEAEQRGRLAGFGVNPRVRAVIDQAEMVLHMTVRAENQRLPGAAGRQVVELLGADAVQPGEPVLASDPDHVPVRAVDEAGRIRQCPLLCEAITVVRGHAHVGFVGSDGVRDR